MSAVCRLLLRLALGRRTYQYMVRTLQYDTRLRTARSADIVVRKDAREERIEADWLKAVARIVHGASVPMEYTPGPLGLLSKWLKRRLAAGRADSADSSGQPEENGIGPAQDQLLERSLGGAGAKRCPCGKPSRYSVSGWCGRGECPAMPRGVGP